MSSNTIVTTLYIDNMTCTHCETTIEHALTGIPGIENVKASYSSGKVIVTYKPDEIALKNIEELIEENDYHVKREKKGNHKNSEKETKIEEIKIKEIKIKETKIKETKQVETKKSVDITKIAGIGIIIFLTFSVVNISR